MKPHRELDSFSIDRTERADVVVLRLNGSLKHTSTHTLRDEIQRAVSEGMKNIIIDLTHCGLIDSGGYGSLLMCGPALSRKGGSVSISGASPEIKERLSSMGIDKVIPVYPTVSRAMSRFFSPEES